MKGTHELSPTAENMKGDKHLRLAELMAAFSLAMDLGLGQPLEWIMRTCLLGVNLAERLGLDIESRRLVYYLSLLRHIGCTSTASWEAAVFGNELAMGEALVTDARVPVEALRFLLRTPGKGEPPLRRVRYLGKALAAGPAMKEEVDRIQCEVAGMLALRLGFGPEMLRCLGQIFERWDGNGIPAGLAGRELELPVRVAHLAHDAATMAMMRDIEAALEMAGKRSGRLYDPEMVAVLQRDSRALLNFPRAGSTWEFILAAEPGPAVWLSEAEFDEALAVMADFADLKAPHFAGHSRDVAELAAAAGRELRLPLQDVVTLRRAGFIHDLGKVAVSAAIWNKAGPLTEMEWERVRLHPYLTERILARSEAFAPLLALASLHHERLDASGYHGALPAAMQPRAARLLAVANMYIGLTTLRPYQPALTAAEAARRLQREVDSGRLDGSAVTAVLKAAGHERARRKRSPGTDLSPREIEVLRLLVRGMTNKEMAAELVISPKTVGHHIQHIYNKIGVSSRAAATLYAMEHHVL